MIYAVYTKDIFMGEVANVKEDPEELQLIDMEGKSVFVFSLEKSCSDKYNALYTRTF